MGFVRKCAPLGATLLLAACVAPPPPPLVAMPGKTKDVAAFQSDEQACRQAASQAAYPAPAKGTADTNTAAWQRYDAAYAQCMTGRGNLVQPVPYAYGYAPYGYYAGGYYGYADPFFYPGYYGAFYGGIGLIGFGYGYGHYGYWGHPGWGTHGFGPGGFSGFTHGASAHHR